MQPAMSDRSLITEINVEQINTQLLLLLELKMRLSAELLQQFASKQPYGINSDEYKTIKRLKEIDPANIRLQKNCRLAEYPSYYEETIPNYNGNVYKGYIVCEGPDPEKNDAVERFLANIVMNKYHAGLDTIIVSGLPNDHFSKPYEHILNYANYIPVDISDSKVYGDFIVTRKQSSTNRSTPGIEHICLEIKRQQYGVTVTKQLEVFRFVRNPDLARAQITQDDMSLLLEVALRNPNRIAFHCGAGLSRSVSKLLMFIIFKILNEDLLQFVKKDRVDIDIFLNKIANEYQRIRVHRPGAIGNNDLLSEAITQALELRLMELKAQKRNLKQEFKKLTMTSIHK